MTSSEHPHRLHPRIFGFRPMGPSSESFHFARFHEAGCQTLKLFSVSCLYSACICRNLCGWAFAPPAHIHSLVRPRDFHLLDATCPDLSHAIRFLFGLTMKEARLSHAAGHFFRYGWTSAPICGRLRSIRPPPLSRSRPAPSALSRLSSLSPGFKEGICSVSPNLSLLCRVGLGGRYYWLRSPCYLKAKTGAVLSLNF